MAENHINLHPNLPAQAGHFIVTLALSGFASFFASGFLQNFYPYLWQILIVTILANVFSTLVFDFTLNHLTNTLKTSSKSHVNSFLVLALGMLVAVLTISLLLKYPSTFSADFFLPKGTLLAIYPGVALFSSGSTLFAKSKTKWQLWQNSQLAQRIQRNLPGLLLAITITIATFTLATAFNHPGINNVDNYFDTDSGDWVNRLTAEVADLIPLRPVHPIAFLILRPPAWLLSVILNGEKFHAVTLLNALMGGVCIYLTWLFFKHRTNNTTYALLMAALLGLSSSHLILSVFPETYIFSASVLIAFMLLIQLGERSPVYLLPIGLLTFGITITNFAQTCIAYFITHLNIKNLLKYIGLVIGIASVLAFAQKVIYPSSEPFYLPSKLQNEHVYGFNIFEEETRLIISRANVLLRNIFLMNVVAPRPLILMEEAGCTFPCFQTMFKIGGIYYRYASYVDFGSLLARTWFLAVTLAGILYIRHSLKQPQQTAMQTALLANILFNFILHMNYGDDPILYSPDWTYALVFFLGISYEQLADKKWFQMTLLIFITALALNNLDLFRKMLDAVSPFITR